MSATQPETFAASLRRLRRAQWLSQSDVAARIGVSARAVHDYEAGHYQPRAQIWLALRRLLGKELLEP